MQVTTYLDKATTKLRSLGIAFQVDAQAPVLPLLEKVAKYDNARIAVIANTLQQSSIFNAAVRDQIQGMEISTRYADVTNSFNSIRDDAQSMAKWMEDGKLDMGERIQAGWMKLRRGSIPDRFNDIRKTYLQVAESANDQIQRENLILEAYRDFRMALKAAESEAQEVLKTATAELAARKADLEKSNAAVEAYTGDDQAERSRIELARDEHLRAVQDEDKAYQIVKDLADDIKTSYNTAELVFARLQQTHTVKERLYQRAVTFFATNETVFTGLAASFTSMAGLSEATNTMESMKEGMNKSLEYLAQSGTQALQAGMRAGYGSTLQVSSVKALADAVVEFQATSLKLVEELRQESTRSAQEIEAASEDSKRRFVALVNKGV